MKSIKDIANLANVSPGTVDRVIHNRGGVSEKTKERVQKIIEESNFKINSIASSLALKKNYKIATLIPKPVSGNDFWNFPLKGIHKALEEIKNYGVALSNFNFDQFNAQTYGTAFEQLLDSNPNAVLIAPIFKKETKTLVHQLEFRNIPYLFINVEIEGLRNVSFIGQNSYNGGYLAAKMMHLLIKKNTAVSIIKIRRNIDNLNAIEQRIKGFMDYFQKNYSKTAITTVVIKDINNPSDVHNVLVQHLLENPKTKALYMPYSSSGKIAQYLCENKLKGIHLIGFDGTPENIFYLKKGVIDFLIGQKPFEQGYEGIKILFDYLVHQKSPKKHYYSPIEIIAKENVDFIKS